ncbi:type II toxin-antitoxin system VapB family antitoxin [Trueperella pecoris]|uniref:Type II toxin-antitoxin system VapB family antitoxin n=1 Tax=Trueperella pecoris TaxID=2733571 RepID=A0A7M1QV75_9ACTO|nr:type II toxin-antitoxin system VapB family antitoxin [Trueperella pecoris]QOR45701.1 type II toxin-antitoxin system VapB family antitoxin [Trueperella pecoris]QTG75541.1 type II toxin-antitoxin system VapB family antitoxin [Trueperella pecoris]
MPTMNIKDEDVYNAARQLAQLRGTSMTGAVRSAVEEALDAEIKRRERGRLRLAELQDRIAQAAEPRLDESDLYDDRGMPR